MQKILVSGSIAYDYVMDYPAQFRDVVGPDKDMVFVVPTLLKADGGTAQNIAYSLGLLWLKEETVMLASVGKDFVPSTQLMQYIHYNWIKREEDMFTACAFMVNDQDGHQMITFHPGAFAESDKLRVRDVLVEDVIWNFAYAIMSPLPPAAALVQLQECKELGIKTFFDPGQNLGLYNQDQLRQSLDLASYCISNEYEHEQILKMSGYSQSDLLSRVEKIVITLGKDGVKIIDQNGEIIVPGVKVEYAIDPTGAGDSFRSGLLAGLFEGKSREDAAKLGNVVASRVVQSQGTMNHVFTKEEILEEVKRIYW